jgi:hypothetical protein
MGLALFSGQCAPKGDVGEDKTSNEHPPSCKKFHADVVSAAAVLAAAAAAAADAQSDSGTAVLPATLQ